MSIRDRIYTSQQGRCWLCGGLMLRPKLLPTAEEVAALFTRDHIKPKSRGGKNDRANLMGAHRWCNQQRGSEPPDLAGPRIRAMLANPQGSVQVFIASLQGQQWRPPFPEPRFAPPATGR